MMKISASRLVAWWADKNPEAPWIIHEERIVTRAAFESRTNRLARAYCDCGVKEGDLVTIALPNGVEVFEAIFAVWKLGATPQLVSPLLPQHECNAVISVADPTLVVGLEPDNSNGLQWLPAGFEPDNSICDALLPEKTARIWRAPTSGGSTGKPKIVLIKKPAQFDVRDPGSPIDVPNPRLVAGPLYHSAPFSFCMDGFQNGVPLVVMSRFDAAEALRLLATYKVETTSFVPTMMHRIWSLPEEKRLACDLSHLKFMVHTGAPCPPWLKEAWINWLGPEKVIEFYGGTEGHGRTFITGNEWLSHRGSVGRPVPGCSIKVVSEDGSEVPPGTVGEVYFLPDGGQGSTYEYRGAEPKAIAGGWESLGDMGSLDEEGYLYLADRQTDMILSGGANIYPAEVEAAIEAYPGVRSSAVIGLPDEAMGSLVHAIVDVGDALPQVTKEDLLIFLAGELVRYKVPRTIEFVNHPLRNDAGKLRRSELRKDRISGV